MIQPSMFLYGEDLPLPLRLLFFVLGQRDFTSPSFIVALVLFVLFVGAILFFGFQSLSWKHDKKGTSFLVGEEGEVTKISSKGKVWVFLHGEYWKGFSLDKLEIGDRVRVAKIQKMILQVEKIK